ncbi:MAG: phosphate starvation-inducible protein PhoH [Desulfobacteraceae bacterium 4572_130]|nr:MAG: phosphate starvation-inducible protein PhoH [Desulfobacteraceae bacterium 4572_130]
MKSITFDNIDFVKELFGSHNSNLTRIAELSKVKIDVRGNSVNLQGDNNKIILVEKILTQLYELINKNFSLYPADIDSAVKALKADDTCQLKNIFFDTIFVTAKKKAITPRNFNQKKYIDASRKHDIIFSLGPAGTGKTYLAMAIAVAALTKGETNRIVLTRPAVEAGETLGFLPGDLSEKINPYLRPLYDALYDMLGFEKTKELIVQGIIEVAPLAFMRGRTLNNSFVVLDEAQNTSSEQMKMFLTRLGYSSKAIITGDITQIDLPSGKQSGLVEAKNILIHIKGLKFIYFHRRDIVRHKLVSKIIQAYEKLNNIKK